MQSVTVGTLGVGINLFFFSQSQIQYLSGALKNDSRSISIRFYAKSCWKYFLQVKTMFTGWELPVWRLNKSRSINYHLQETQPWFDGTFLIGIHQHEMDFTQSKFVLVQCNESWLIGHFTRRVVKPSQMVALLATMLSLYLWGKRSQEKFVIIFIDWRIFAWPDRLSPPAQTCSV